ncbi:MAG: RpiB/LacA/LacB family sugar-phosphate isomerase [Vicinamibacterales bacterium]
MTSCVIALAADHAGFALKNSLKAVLDEHSFPLVELGPETPDPVDYPDMAGKLAAALNDGRAQQGLLVCGTGIGIAIAANRYPWIRAAVCHDVTAARLAREHHDANVLALGAPDRARGGARLSADLHKYALCRGPPRAGCGQDVVARVRPKFLKGIRAPDDPATDRAGGCAQVMKRKQRTRRPPGERIRSKGDALDT